MNASKNVVVVGAGIAGLTAALALLKRGIDVQVFEQSDQLKEVGAGIQISSNGTRVLFALGLEAALAGAPARPGTGSILATKALSGSARRISCCTAPICIASSPPPSAR
jgi:2-polyprenyl-6-methoxyphenol hydroxylase-like FAD-dependent oxidoreductase